MSVTWNKDGPWVLSLDLGCCTFFKMKAVDGLLRKVPVHCAYFPGVHETSGPQCRRQKGVGHVRLLS